MENENTEHDATPETDEVATAEVLPEGGMPGLVLAQEILPDRILILPVATRPMFPGLTLPVQVSGAALDATLKAVSEDEHHVLGVVLAQEYDEEAPLRSTLHAMGTVVRVLRLAEGPGVTQLLVQAVRRFRRLEVVSMEPTIVWRVEYFFDPEGRPDEETKAYTVAVIGQVKELLKLNPLFQEQLKLLLTNFNYDSPGLICDLTASMLTADAALLQEVLETVPLVPRAEKLLKLLAEEIQLFRLKEKIQKSIEEKISKQQKEFFLKEQLKAIKQELGLEKDDRSAELDRFRARLEKIHLSEEATTVVEAELEKLSVLEPASPEYNVSRTYLDWLTVLPWGVYSEDSFDIKRSREILNNDHYGLEDVKDRILEFISTGIKTGRVSGSILCLVGPPGVGKTSIGRSVASALNRKFYRFSVGGMRDEAEIKGHRRTYIGAMPGKFLQSLKTVATANPVIMLDEIDKIGASYQGDPAAALLEVLDPEQNRDFLDHYLDVRFDLSRVLFITTANQLDTIPSALLDRMEILKLSGYILEEKLQIAQRYLIPRARTDHGLSETDVTITEAALRFIIDRYAREAGVRNLENQIKKIMRKLTLAHAEGFAGPRTIEQEQLTNFLGQPVFPDEVMYRKAAPGVVTGLAWTSLGGVVLYIEATAMAAKSGGFQLTGQLGDVMKESAEIAYSYVRSRSGEFGVPADYFESNLLHLHVPAGATPKDGPSAGVTMTIALYSLATGQPVRLNVAMTGEITLTGRVLAVGGIKEKIIAARRIGIHELVLPRDNLNDYKELPDFIRAGLKVYFVTYFDDARKAVFGDGEQGNGNF